MEEDEEEASESECERCGVLLAATIRKNTVLHTFEFDICPKQLLENAVQSNHSLIRCVATEDFDAELLFNRVSVSQHFFFLSFLRFRHPPHRVSE